MSLPGPSRRITVTPIKAPEPIRETPSVPEPTPKKEPVRV